jgi:PPIC-type PPIASE domain
MIARRYRRVAVGLVVGAIGLGLTGCSSSASDAATVTYRDGSGSHTVHITRSDFEDELHQLLSNPKFEQVLKSGGYPNLGGTTFTDPSFSTQWLTGLIQQVAFDAEAQSDRVTVTPADTAGGTAHEQSVFTAAAVFDAFSKPFAAKLVGRAARLYAVLRYYQTCPSGRFVSHILLKTKVQADVALRIIQSGQSFATVAKQQSTDTGSAQQGGGLGCLTPNEFVAPFEDAANAAPLDVVTGPVKTPFGYHLILVRRWDPVADKSYAQALSQAASVVLRGRIADFHVSVDPRYGTWGKQTTANGTQLAVLPPVVPALRTCREKTAACGSPTTATTTTTVPAGG